MEKEGAKEEAMKSLDDKSEATAFVVNLQRHRPPQLLQQEMTERCHPVLHREMTERCHPVLH